MEKAFILMTNKPQRGEAHIELNPQVYAGIESEGKLNVLFALIDHTIAEVEHGEDKYFDEEQDKADVKTYYKGIKVGHLDDLRKIRSLVQETHKNQIIYDPIIYVYPWVDLYPDFQLKNIYSGKKRGFKEVMKEDLQTSLQRTSELEASDQDVWSIMRKHKFNCEHVVPQSWFEGKEPMRGDLHHLFTCDPLCNSIRSNYPYYDFKDYPEGQVEANRIEDQCGKAEDERFEPEYGKGIVSRAMLYFFLRYPDIIESTYKKRVDIELLLKWHDQEPPGIYEYHRNQAIYDIQKNRNPFIDYPKEMSRLIKQNTSFLC
ncbi:endonuclease I family protein [Halobacillus sp. B23F22_1]|uniref:endonuclease I family protein n=1 Tax=Halobacillus sp. B23F22_1 TaxID=3459514 RepID=UPI00373E03C1